MAKALRKALARQHSRAKGFDTLREQGGRKRPGSMNAHKGTFARPAKGEGVNRSRQATPRTSTRPGGGRTRKAA